MTAGGDEAEVEVEADVAAPERFAGDEVDEDFEGDISEFRSQLNVLFIYELDGDSN